MDFNQPSTKIEITVHIEPVKINEVKKGLEEILELVNPEELQILIKGLSNPTLKKLALEYLK